MKTRVKTTIIINASTTAVFKYLADTRLHYVWNAHLRELKPLGKLHVGDQYESLNFVLGVRVRTYNHVTKLIENQEMQLESHSGMLLYKINYRLRELSPKETELTCTTRLTVVTKAFDFAGPMLEHLARRELNTDLAALKKGVEHKLT